MREIRNAVELMIARLESQLKSKLLTLMGKWNNPFWSEGKLSGVATLPFDSYGPSEWVQILKERICS